MAPSNAELNRFNRLIAGGDLRVMALKRQASQRSAQLGRSVPYPLAFLDPEAVEVP